MDAFDRRRLQLKGDTSQVSPSISLKTNNGDAFDRRRQQLSSQKLQPQPNAPKETDSTRYNFAKVPIQPNIPSSSDIISGKVFQNIQAPKINTLDTPVTAPTPLQNAPSNPVADGINKFRQGAANLVLKGLDYLGRAGNTAVNVMSEVNKKDLPTADINKITLPQQKLQNVGGAFVKGITGQSRPDPLQIAGLTAQQAQQVKKDYPLVGNVSSFALGALSDPLTYVGGEGINAVVKKALPFKKAVKAVDVSINTERDVQRLADSEIFSNAIKNSVPLNPNNQTIGRPIQTQLGKSLNKPTGNSLLDSVRSDISKGPVSTGNSMLDSIRADTGITKDIKNPSNAAYDLMNKTVSKPVVPELSKTSKQPLVNTNTLNEGKNSLNGTQNVIGGIPKIYVGREPIIPKGQKERGFSANTRTDLNNPDELRNSFSENPLTYEQLSNKETLSKAESIFSKGTAQATSDFYTSLASKEFKPENVPLSKLIAREAVSRGDIGTARQVLSDMSVKLTEAGQFSQAARLLRESDPETFLMTIDKQLKKLNKEGLDTYGKKWKNVDLTPDELDLVSKMKRGDDKAYEAAFEQIQSRIANEMPSNASEKINAWRHMSMLLNPKTHIRNVGGNAIMLGMRKTAQRVSGVIQGGIKAINPKFEKTQSVFVNKEYKQAAKDYFEANKKDLLSGTNKYNESLNLNMPNKRVFKNNGLEAVRKFNYDLLQKGDNPFFKNAYVDRLASYAQAKGIKDFSKLNQEAFDIAKKEAEQATYKDASVIASFLNKVKNPGKGANLGQKAGAVLTEAALPFTKTPINIIKRGIQYSPAGIVNGIAKIKSSEGAATAIDEMAKGLTGTGILGLGYLLAKHNILTGKAEKDADLASYNSNTGHSPFSVLGKYTYDWAQPFSVPLTVGVEIYNAIKDSPEDAKKMDALIQNNDTSKLEEMAKKFAVGMLDSFNASGDTVFNMSIMKGIRQLLGSGTKGFMESLAQTPQNYAMQFIPTVASQMAGQVDPTVRQTYYKGNPLESAKATALSKIPIVSKSLEAKQTPWGQDVKRNENPLARAFSQFLSPGIMNEPQNINPEVDTELRRLNKQGETIQFPTIAANSFTWKGQRFNLSPKEYSDFQRTLGQNTLAAYTDYIKTPEYQKLNDSEKAKELSNIISDAKDLAKFQLIKNKGLSSNPEIMNVPNKLEFNNKSQELNFDQQKELANNIVKYKTKMLENQEKNKKEFPHQRIYTDKEILSAAREQANEEMKIKIGLMPKSVIYKK